MLHPSGISGIGNPLVLHDTASVPCCRALPASELSSLCMMVASVVHANSPSYMSVNSQVRSRYLQL